jgi:hypothetical protein
MTPEEIAAKERELEERARALDAREASLTQQLAAAPTTTFETRVKPSNLKLMVLLIFTYAYIHIKNHKKLTCILCEGWLRPKEQAQMISVMAAIWDSRNRVVHGSEGFVPAKSVESIEQDLLEIVLPKKATTRLPAKPVCTWKPPEGGVVKINSDGAICAAEGRARSGGVPRDAMGFRGAWAMVHSGVRYPFIAEALAFRDAVIFARARGFQKVVFETDCQELVRC